MAAMDSCRQSPSWSVRCAGPMRHIQTVAEAQKGRFKTNCARFRGALRTGVEGGGWSVGPIGYFFF